MCHLCRMSDERLRTLESDLLTILKDDDADFDFELEGEDAEVMATLFSVVEGVNAELAMGERHGREPTPDDYARMVREATYQLDHALGLLSPSARERLTPVLNDVRMSLARMSSGHLNSIQFAARMAETMGRVEAQGGGVTDGVDYSPYEWARLCRTESAFARSAVERQILTDDWGCDTSAADAVGSVPPHHPNCLCSQVPYEIGGRMVIIFETAPSACETCHGYADAVLAEAGI